MTEYSKFNIVYRLQKWLDSVPGQTFLNYAYSWGASIVILGTLFKLTHLPGANIMLYLGMGTEVIVFFISAFDRPFDKTADGKDLPTHIDEVDEDGFSAEGVQAEAGAVVTPVVMQPGVVYAGAPVQQQPVHAQEEGSADGSETPVETPIQPVTAPTIQPAAAEGQAEGTATQPVTPLQIPQPSAEWIMQQQQVSPEMEEATNNYVEELKRLTEMLGKVSDQSARLTRDSEEMENLNRTLTGICKVYEMQLKGASSQIGTIDQINEQSRKMAGQIEQLNKIYARMIEAMTVNMRAAAPNVAKSEE